MIGWVSIFHFVPRMKMTDDPRLNRLLNAPILPLIGRMSVPNIGVMVATTLVIVADAWFVGHLGTVALAALAIVYPVQALMQMMSAGAMGGGVSSAVARSLGSGQRERADAILVHAVIIAIVMSAVYVVGAAIFARPLFALLGGRDGVLDGAVTYAQITFGAAALMWLSNTFASAIRGTGNMFFPAAVLTVISIFQVPLSGALTLGWGPFPALGIAGPAWAMVIGLAAATLVTGAYLLGGQGGVRLHFGGVTVQWALFADIMKVGAVACGNALLTITTVLVVTRLVASQGTAALAGYGLGSRLELLLIPISFGVGGVLTATVGANFGAGQYRRARRVAWTGGLSVGAVTGLLGVTVAIWPGLWLDHFTADAEAREMGVLYLRIVGPMYGMFGMGMALYFASQGTGNMVWPFSAGVLRILVAAAGGALAILVFGSGPMVLFICVSAGLVCFGGPIALSLFSRVWKPTEG